MLKTWFLGLFGQSIVFYLSWDIMEIRGFKTWLKILLRIILNKPDIWWSHLLFVYVCTRSYFIQMSETIIKLYFEFQSQLLI